MKVTQDQVVDQVAAIHITIEADDYSQKVEAELKKIQKTLALPGFRTGHVPKSLIEKRFKKDVIRDIVSHQWQEELYKYMDDPERTYQQIGVFDVTDNNTWDKLEENASLSFTLKTHVVPKVDFSKLKSLSIQDYAIKIDEDYVEGALLNKLLPCLESKALEDGVEIEEGQAYRVMAILTSGEEKIGGNFVAFVLTPRHAKIMQSFKGKKCGDTITIDKSTLVDYTYQMNCGMVTLPIIADKITTPNVTVELKYVDHYVWEDNYLEKMFTRYYPTEKDKTEATLKKFIGEELEEELKNVVTNFHYNNQLPILLRKTFDLPIPVQGIIEEIQSRMREQKPSESQKTQNDSQYIPTQEEIESQTKSYKLHYIYRQFIRDTNLTLTTEERETAVRDSVEQMYGKQVPEESYAAMRQLIENNEEMRSNIYNRALMKKLLSEFMQQVSLTAPKNITYQKFVELLNQAGNEKQ